MFRIENSLPSRDLVTCIKEALEHLVNFREDNYAKYLIVLSFGGTIANLEPTEDENLDGPIKKF